MTNPLELLKKYGTVKAIPDAELVAIGLQKSVIETDGTEVYRIEKLGSEDSLRFRKVGPFDRLEVIVSKNSSFRSLPRQLYGNVVKRLKEDVINPFFDNDYDNKKPVPARQSLQVFADAAENYLKRNFPHREEEGWYSEADLLNRYARVDLLSSDERMWAIEVFVEGIYSEEEPIKKAIALEEGAQVMPKEKVEDLHRYLEKIRSHFNDLRELQKWRKSTIDECPLLDEDIYTGFGEEWKTVCTPEFVSHLGSELGTFYQYLVREVLKDEGFTIVANDLQKQPTIDNYITYLQSVKGDKLPSFEKAKELKKKISGAPIEEKKILSQELKQLKEREKSERQLLEGALHFFTPEKIFAERVNKDIKSIQDMLSYKGEGEETLYLDGKPHRALDENPGKVSGDCTEDMPLPFYDKRVHNVKVFKENDDHIGNIYLFETKARGYKKVWHLDAVQIPQQADWDKTVEALVDTIATAAEEKNVDGITVNKEGHLISNYDYIDEAAIRYHQHHGGEMSTVNLGSVRIKKGYQGFQGTEEARLLWKRK